MGLPLEGATWPFLRIKDGVSQFNLGCATPYTSTGCCGGNLDLNQNNKTSPQQFEYVFAVYHDLRWAPREQSEEAPAVSCILIGSKLEYSVQANQAFDLFEVVQLVCFLNEMKHNWYTVIGSHFLPNIKPRLRTVKVWFLWTRDGMAIQTNLFTLIQRF